MKYALIGCGRIAVNHIKAALNNGLEICAVCDIKPEAMETLLSKYGLEKEEAIRRYTSYRDLLAAEKPTLVSIATESGIHAEIALACIDAGVNIIIEKPMAMSMADAEEIIRRSEQAGVKVSACHQNRFNTAVQETRKALMWRCGRLERPWRKGALGRSPMVPSMFGGTGTGTITTRPRGGAPGRRMVAAL